MLATLRTTNSSPGLASKITSGETRESQQPITMISRRLAALGQFAVAVLLALQPAAGEGVVAVDQSLRKVHRQPSSARCLIY